MHFGGEPAGMGSERVPSPRVRKGTTGTTNRTDAFKEPSKTLFYERVSPVLEQERVRQERRHKIFQHSYVDLKINKGFVARPRPTRPATPPAQAERLKELVAKSEPLSVRTRADCVFMRDLGLKIAGWRKKGGIQHLFRLCDGDGDGRLSFTEMQAGFDRVNMGLSEAQFARLCKTLDTSGSGDVDMREFATFFERYEPLMPDDAIYVDEWQKTQTEDNMLTAVPWDNHVPLNQKFLNVVHGPAFPNQGKPTEPSMTTTATQPMHAPGEEEAMQAERTAHAPEEEETMRAERKRVADMWLVRTFREKLLYSQPSASAAMQKYDLTGDGHLSLAELQRAVRLLVPGAAEADIRAMMQAYDTNKNGYLRLQEFARIFDDSHPLEPQQPSRQYYHGHAYLPTSPHYAYGPCVEHGSPVHSSRPASASSTSARTVPRPRPMSASASLQRSTAASASRTAATASAAASGPSTSGPCAPPPDSALAKAGGTSAYYQAVRVYGSGPPRRSTTGVTPVCRGTAMGSIMRPQSASGTLVSPAATTTTAPQRPASASSTRSAAPSAAPSTIARSRPASASARTNTTIPTPSLASAVRPASATVRSSVPAPRCSNPSIAAQLAHPSRARPTATPTDYDAVRASAPAAPFAQLANTPSLLSNKQLYGRSLHRPVYAGQAHTYGVAGTPAYADDRHRHADKAEALRQMQVQGRASVLQTHTARAARKGACERSVSARAVADDAHADHKQRNLEANKAMSHTRWLSRSRLYGKCAQESLAMGRTSRLNVFASRG